MSFEIDKFYPKICNNVPRFIMEFQIFHICQPTGPESVLFREWIGMRERVFSYSLIILGD
jgi:hypothetical protein